MKQFCGKYTAGLLLGAIIFLSGCNSQKSKDTDITASDSIYIEPDGLNYLYTNQDSEFDETTAFDKKVVRFMKQWEIVGASVAIMKNDSLIYCKGYGYSNKEQEEATDVKHLFRIASVSKLITAVAIMKLVEEDKLTLDTPVFGENGILSDTTILKIKDKKIKNITIENLLRHQGGFSRRAGDPLFDLSIIQNKLNRPAPFSSNDLVEFASGSRLSYLPGTYTSYSNLGYALLGKIIEVITNQSYEEYVRESILKPAGCKNMFIGNNRQEDHHKDEVNYYEPEDHDMVPDLLDPSKKVRKSNGGNDVHLLGAAGGWIASPIELMKFVASIDGSDSTPQLLSKESIRIMTEAREHSLPIGWMKTYGSSDWRRSGSMAGTSALVRHQPDGYTWVFISNTSSWKGAEFTSFINQMMSQNIKTVKEWPKRDMFETSAR